MNEVRRRLAWRIADKLTTRATNTRPSVGAVAAVGLYVVDLERRGVLLPAQARALEIALQPMTGEAAEAPRLRERTLERLALFLLGRYDIFGMDDLKRLNDHWGDVEATVLGPDDWD